jgi:hypothetical protein
MLYSISTESILLVNTDQTSVYLIEANMVAKVFDWDSNFELAEHHNNRVNTIPISAI